jgi:hypothetical protein
VAVKAVGATARGSVERPIRAAVPAVVERGDAGASVGVQWAIELLRVRDRFASEAVAASPTVI